MARRLVVLSAGLLGAWTLAAGCAASGSSNQLNGPAFDLDAAAKATDDSSVASDGAKTSPPLDGSSKGDSSSGGGSPEAGSNEDATPPVDSGNGGDTGGGSDGGTCTSTTAILGGSASSFFGATATGTGALVTHAISGSVAAAPALVAFGGGFEALVAEAVDASAGNALYGIGFSGGAWSAPSALGGSASAIDAPAAAVVGTTLQGVYLNPQHFYFHASFATAWDTGADPVRPPNDAGAAAFGPVRASAAGTATELVIAYEGNNLLPYAQTWTTGVGWDDGMPLGSATLAANTAMAIVALSGGGASDLLAVFVEQGGACTGASGCLYAVLRSASAGSWSAPALVNTTAFSPAAPTLAPMSGGRALLAWKGGNGEGYESVYSGGAWSTPAQLTAAQVLSAPSVAEGICGDDAVATYVSGGVVYTTQFAGGVWTSPAALSGESGVTAASIATAP